VFYGHTRRHANKRETDFLLRMTKESITLGLNRFFFQLSQRQSQMVTGVTVVTDSGVWGCPKGARKGSPGGPKGSQKGSRKGRSPGKAKEGAVCDL
jgi:hypothetical protein